MSRTCYPPGTQIIEDVTGKQLILAPQPSADPNQPLNWSKWRKTVHMTILCFYTLLAFSFLSVSSPLWTVLTTDLPLTYDDLNNGYAISQVTLATGCVFGIPLAARYGRRPVYIGSGLILIATGIWSGRMQNNGDNYGSSTILGLGSCINEALFQVSVTDLFFVHERGTINGLYLAIVMVGTYLSPVASGYIATSYLQWRWVFYLITIIMAVCVVLMICFLEETKYTPGAIITRQAAAVSVSNKSQREEESRGHTDTDSTKHDFSQSEANVVNNDGRYVAIDHSIAMAGYRKRLAWITPSTKSHPNPTIWQSLSRPFIVLLTFPAILFTAIQYGFLIAMICILNVTQAILYAGPPYNFSAAGIGNMNIAPAIGCILGSVYGGPVNDYCIRLIARRRGGVYEPETRLWLFCFPGIFLPAGTLLYGLTIARGMAWPLNAVGAGFIGFAIGGCGDIVLTYCQDSYQHIIGEALTGVVFVRNIVSCPLVFAISPWMSGMGVYGMFVLLGCFAAGVVLTAVPLVVWGRDWRVKCAPKYEMYSGRAL